MQTAKEARTATHENIIEYHKRALEESEKFCDYFEENPANKDLVALVEKTITDAQARNRYNCWVNVKKHKDLFSGKKKTIKKYMRVKGYECCYTRLINWKLEEHLFIEWD